MKNPFAKPTVYGPSKSIPGLSLKPSELLKRHLAGTLPEIDSSSKYTYHVDENGEQIGEPYPMEMHEFHALAVAIRKRQFEAATEARRLKMEKFKSEIVEEWKKNNPPATPTVTE